MARLKQVGGALLLAAMPWLLSPMLPAWTVMALAAWLLMAGAVALGTFDPMPHATPGATFVRGLGMVLATLALAQLVGVAMGARDPLQPLRRTPPTAAPPASAAPQAPAAPAAPGAPLSPGPATSSAARAPAA